MIVLAPGYTVPVGDAPLSHARIAHAGNWLSGGTVTASDTGTGFFADGPDNSLTFEKWRPATLPATWEYDHGSDAECDYCVIAAHTLGTTAITTGVQYYDDVAEEWVDLVTAFAPTTNAPIFVIFPPQTRQRWRIALDGAGSVPAIGFIKFGAALQMERPLYGAHSPIPFGRQTAMRTNETETGEFVGYTKQRTFLATAYQWNNLTAGWVRDNWLDLQIAAETEPVVIAWRPSTFGDVAFSRAQVSPPQNTGIRDLMSAGMQIRALSYD